MSAEVRHQDALGEFSVPGIATTSLPLLAATEKPGTDSGETAFTPFSSQPDGTRAWRGFSPLPKAFPWRR